NSYLYSYPYSRPETLNSYLYSYPYSGPETLNLHLYSHPVRPSSYPYSQSVTCSDNTIKVRVSDRMKVTTKEITVFRFPQHSSDIDLLPPEEKAKMDALAKEIADSFILGNSPIVAFVIAGHADRDPQGADFEMKVSVTRAEAAQKWLVNKAKELVRQRGGDPSEVDTAEFSLFGYGASNLYTTATTFPEREKNRRIVVKYASVELDPLSDAIGYAPNLARLVTLVQLHLNDNPDRMGRIQCALAKLANPVTDDTYFEWSSLSKYPGALKDLTDEQILSVAREIIKSLRRHIANNNLYGLQVPDDLVIQNILKWEENVRDVKDKLVKHHGIPAMGQIQKDVGRYIARKQDDTNSILSCFKNT
ncbi:hypothetical protein ACQVWA_28845, partial [Bacillus cereus]|uniref:hypothetical protein n=1 Tax=Bacillus cereus TaxID=1396 RepID=UPI003D653EFF